MAEPLKNLFNPTFFEKLCPVMRANIPGFDCRDFIFRVFNNQWPELELKERIRHISTVLHHFLPDNFPKAARILAALSQELKKTAKSQQDFLTIFIPDYIQIYGIDYPDEAFQALEEVTRLVSAEFAVRPFILRYPEKAMKQMLRWSTHPDANVRRLSSEGCRPRLPWAMALPQFKKDPTLVLAILENLKEDPSEYVRRSVANNLNDIAKDHPDLVLSIAGKWQGKNPETDRVIKHACRTLLKKGNGAALKLHGYNPKSKASIKNLNLKKKKINIGDHLRFDFGFINEERKTSNFRLEYAIDYITSSGKTSTKVFKIAESKFEPNKQITISRKQSFKDFTTRKHFKGKHLLTIIANGRKLASSEFYVK